MFSNKKGSALLIVIGFLSFMIVSAVAFSIYMRSERMPSSALRRTVATRQLAKAAFAEAISRVDDAVRGSPFPGLNDSATSGYAPRGATESFWEGRVFMPPNRDYNDEKRNYAPVSQTVSVLTLEGLGYVPPPLVNDARFLGRSTWTASWQNLPYDAGRFAFVALNVSDYFDINRVYADRPRTSNADGRISMAYLLDANEDGNGELTSVDKFDKGDTKKFDQFVHEQRNGGNDAQAVGKDAPFVSVLDYQLAVRDSMGEIMKSPFYTWVTDNTQRKSFYIVDDTNRRMAERQPFVADSCTTNECYDIDIAYYKSPKGKYKNQNVQPFDKDQIQQENSSLSDAVKFMMKNKFFTQMKNMEGNTKLANSDSLPILSTLLYDYLDPDNVPLSLAWPCVERVPSIVAIEPLFSLNVPEIQAEGQTAGTTRWTFKPGDWLRSGKLNTVWTFPFKRNESYRNGKFKAQALIRAFLAPVGLTMRAGEGLGALLRPKTEDDWNDKTPLKIGNMNNVFCFTFTQEQPIELKGNITSDEQAGGECSFEISNSTMGDLQNAVFVEKIRQQSDGESGTETYTYKVGVSPLTLDGNRMFSAPEYTQEQFSQLAGQQLGFYVAVWMRVVSEDEDGKTVDLVPAVIEDDEVLNGADSKVVQLSQYLVKASSGPLMRFKGANGEEPVTLTMNGLIGNGGATSFTGTMQWQPKAFCALDPRFNWAPEDWYVSKEEVKTFSKWLEKTNNYLDSGTAKDNGCDHDIFLAVSNMGFLQSLGEFAFMPQVTDTDNDGLPLLAVDSAPGGFDGQQRETPESIASRACAWTSYAMDWKLYAALEKGGIARSVNTECLVNPYTPDRRIMMAALANTPLDYWAAGVALPEKNSDGKKNEFREFCQNPPKALPKIASATEGLDYAFCEKNGMSYEHLKKISERIMSVMRNRENISDARSQMGLRSNADAWKYIWDKKLDWGLDPNSDVDFNNFLGEDIGVELYGVDRKFLKSYWRDCFANQQQLFLIFVRAESSAIGGPGEGTPAQKGARAVALVWRNPVATTDTSTGTDGASDDENTGNYTEGTRRPHQTRVLFYHQFD